MKNIFYTLLIVLLITVSGCRLDNLSDISRGVNTVTNCCKNISMSRPAATNDFAVNNSKDNDGANPKKVSYLPNYSWDSKMMFW